MKELLLEFGQNILTDDQKDYILNTGQLPDINEGNIDYLNKYYIIFFNTNE